MFKILIKKFRMSKRNRIDLSCPLRICGEGGERGVGDDGVDAEVGVEGGDNFVSEGESELVGGGLGREREKGGCEGREGGKGGDEKRQGGRETKEEEQNKQTKQNKTNKQTNKVKN